MITDKSGHYVYCITGARQERNWRAIGLDRTDVLSVTGDDLSMVVSSHPLTRLVVSAENMMAHAKVIQRVMQEFDSVLPVRFGTIAANAGEIRHLLDRRHQKFLSLLGYMDHKIELDVKGLWSNMAPIYEEVVRENRSIEKAKTQTAKLPGAKYLQNRCQVGMMVQEALLKKKEREAKIVTDYFRNTAVDLKLNRTTSDEMFLNAAFLVDRGREKEFDNLMDRLCLRYRERAAFKYAGPLPVFNFVNVVINSEQWQR